MADVSKAQVEVEVHDDRLPLAAWKPGDGSPEILTFEPLISWVRSAANDLRKPNDPPPPLGLERPHLSYDDACRSFAWRRIVRIPRRELKEWLHERAEKALTGSLDIPRHSAMNGSR